MSTTRLLAVVDGLGLVRLRRLAPVRLAPVRLARLRRLAPVRLARLRRLRRLAVVHPARLLRLAVRRARRARLRRLLSLLRRHRWLWGLRIRPAGFLGGNCLAEGCRSYLSRGGYVCLSGRLPGDADTFFRCGCAPNQMTMTAYLPSDG